MLPPYYSCCWAVGFRGETVKDPKPAGKQQTLNPKDGRQQLVSADGRKKNSKACSNYRGRNERDAEGEPTATAVDVAQGLGFRV